MNSSDQYELPIINGITRGIYRGRVVHDGYQRGWGLQYSDLALKVRNDPIYNYALNLADGRLSNFSEMNRMNIFLIIKFFLSDIPFGNIIEFGSYCGGSAIFMGAVCKELHPGRKVYALDTFQGMPQTDKRVDAHNPGDFSATSIEEVRDAVSAAKLDNVILVQGLFQDTTDKVLKESGPISLAHIDCDIKSGCSYANAAVRPAMVEGGYIVFDDATISSCIGATESVEEMVHQTGTFSEQIWPHFVFRHGLRDTILE